MSKQEFVKKDGEVIEREIDDADLLEKAIAQTATRTQVHATARRVEIRRNLGKVQAAFLDEAKLAGDLFYYGWGKGKNAVEGPSKHLANSLARCWGNCYIDMLPVQEMGDTWVFTAVFVDLETGFSMTRQFAQSKNWTVYGEMDPERKADIRFQIGQSKAIRNVILNALPQYLVEMAMEEAKSGATDAITKRVQERGLPGAVDDILRGLLKAGVPEDVVLKRYNFTNRGEIGLNEIQELVPNMKAIQRGEERPENLFPALGPTAAPKSRSTPDENPVDPFKGPAEPKTEKAPSTTPKTKTALKDAKVKTLVVEGKIGPEASVKIMAADIATIGQFVDAVLVKNREFGTTADESRKLFELAEGLAQRMADGE